MAASDDGKRRDYESAVKAWLWSIGGPTMILNRMLKRLPPKERKAETKRLAEEIARRLDDV